MPTLIAEPAIIRAAGNEPKRIEELASRVNSGPTRSTATAHDGRGSGRHGSE